MGNKDELQFAKNHKTALFYSLLENFIKENTPSHAALHLLSMSFPALDDVIDCLKSPPENSAAIFKALAEKPAQVAILIELCEVSPYFLVTPINFSPQDADSSSCTLLELLINENTEQTDTIIEWIKQNQPELLCYKKHFTGEIAQIQEELLQLISEQNLIRFDERIQQLTPQQFQNIFNVDDGSFLLQIIRTKSYLMRMIDVDTLYPRRPESPSALLKGCQKFLSHDFRSLDEVSRRYPSSTEMFVGTPASSLDSQVSTMDEEDISERDWRKLEEDPEEEDELKLVAALFAEQFLSTSSHEVSPGNTELLSQHDITEIHKLGPSLPDEQCVNIKLGLLPREVVDAFAHRQFWEKLASKGIALLPTIPNIPNQGIPGQIAQLLLGAKLPYITTLNVEAEIVLKKGEDADLRIVPTWEELTYSEKPLHAMWVVSTGDHYGLFILNLNNDTGYYIEPFSRNKEDVIKDCLTHILNDLGPKQIKVITLNQSFFQMSCSDYVIAVLTLIANGIINPQDPESMSSLEGKYLTIEAIQQIRWCEISMFGPTYFQSQLPIQSQHAKNPLRNEPCAGLSRLSPHYSFMSTGKHPEAQRKRSKTGEHCQTDKEASPHSPHFFRTRSVPPMFTSIVKPDGSVGYRSPAITTKA